MRRIRLGRTEARVPAIGLGTWSFGGARKVGRHPVGWSGHDDERARAALVRAAERGIDHWDTADVYGDGSAERLIGSVWGEVDRRRVFLASKVGWSAGDYAHAYHPRRIRECLEGSLANLATDHLDLYYFHRCDFGAEDEYLDDAIAELQRAREEGKIRFVGLSDWKPAKVVRYAPRVDPDVVQPYRNVVDDAWEASGLADWVRRHDAGVAFFSPLKHGLLLGKHASPANFGDGDMRLRIKGFRDPALLAHYRRCRAQIGRRFSERDEPLLDALIGALLSGNHSACALVGLRSPEHVDAAARLGETLTAAEAAWVGELYRGP